MKYIQEQCALNSGNPRVSAHFDDLGTLYQARLWSQLSNKLADVCRNDYFQNDKHLIRLYESTPSPSHHPHSLARHSAPRGL